MRKLVAVMMLSLSVACSSVQAEDSGNSITPAEAIARANNDPQYGVRGQFLMEVKAIGRSEGYSYLNSEVDYRDQRCLTIAMPDDVAEKLERKFGIPIKDLKGRKILIMGVAKRVRILFVPEGESINRFTSRREIGKMQYYYQTQIRVSSPTQIEFAE